MRERIGDSVVVINGDLSLSYRRANGTFCTNNIYTSDWVNGEYNLMRDIKEPPADKTATKYLEVSRSKIQSIPVMGTNTFNSGVCGAGTTYTYVGRLGPGYHVKGNPWHIGGPEIQQAHNEALAFFVAGCADQEVLLANFGWELPSVRNLWPDFKKFLTERKTIRKFLKGEASMTLAYYFGVAPLIGDIVKAIRNLRTIDKHVSWLRENSGKVVKIEFRKSLKDLTFKSSEYPGRPERVLEGIGSKETELRAGYKAWCNITYDVSALSDIQLKTRSLLRIFGFNNPAAVVWEAIPYSFVVDWFTNLGDLISLLEVPIKLPYVIHNSGHGYWVESVIEDYWWTEGKYYPIRHTRTRGYARYPGIPTGISALSLDSPTAMQWVLGACLALQKV